MADKTYLVRRKIADEYSRDDIPNPDAHYIAAFADRAAAEAHLREVDWAYKITTCPVVPNPLEIYPWKLPSSLPEFAVRDWLTEAGLPLPGPAEPPKKMKWMSPAAYRKECRDAEGVPWQEWWQEVMGGTGTTPAQREKVWEAFDGITFHEIEEVKAGKEPGPSADSEIVYAVVLKNWEYGDDWYYGSNETQAVYQTHAAAVAERDRLDADTRWREEWNGGPHEYVVVELLNDLRQLR